MSVRTIRTTHQDLVLIDSSLHDIGDEIEFGSHNPPVELAIEISNSGANLTGFALMVKVNSAADWVALLQTTLWDTVTGVLQGFSGTIKTLASGQKALAVIRPGPIFAAKFQASIANGALSKGTFTSTTNPTNAKAAQTLTIAVLPPVVDDTFTIGPNTYVWKAAPTTVANQIKIEATVQGSLDNAVAAINGGAGAGTAYGSLTVAHPSVTAARSGDTLVVTAIARGTAGNSIAVSETMVDGSWGNTTLLGGTLETCTLDDQVYTFKHSDNIVDANDVEIGAAKEDTLDNLVTKANATQSRITSVRASATMVSTVAATVNATVGNAIVSTETCAACAWGDTTLNDGITTALTVHCSAKTEY